MLTLSQINEVTNSKDGDIYSDLYKDVFGSRPRGHVFSSTEEFDTEFERLVNLLSEKIDEDAIRQTANLEKFKVRVAEVMALVNVDKIRAVEIIAEAEDEADAYKWYGAERLEWCFDLKFGSLKEWLAS